MMLGRCSAGRVRSSLLNKILPNMQMGFPPNLPPPRDTTAQRAPQDQRLPQQQPKKGDRMRFTVQDLSEKGTIHAAGTRAQKRKPVHASMPGLFLGTAAMRRGDQRSTLGSSSA
ncbi:hypothetical protein NDU88_000610 [Pleurodeles waltl]|uniref:Uncharacterized protein n=1 Tax=Pleurodeles waltl TaxID=8319 RepID=A0AAV7LYM0_PLEWA|nr:hypothetical protein NDU88_000610 [Pleurodeles waltl]